MTDRQWHGGDTLPAGDALREQIAYHLRRSWELAEGMALDGNGVPITDAAQVERSCRWHHEQAQVMATVMLADAQTNHGPTWQVWGHGVNLAPTNGHPPSPVVPTIGVPLIPAGPVVSNVVQPEEVDLPPRCTPDTRAKECPVHREMPAPLNLVERES